MINFVEEVNKLKADICRWTICREAHPANYKITDVAFDFVNRKLVIIYTHTRSGISFVEDSSLFIKRLDEDYYRVIDFGDEPTVLIGK